MHALTLAACSFCAQFMSCYHAQPKVAHREVPACGVFVPQALQMACSSHYKCSSIALQLCSRYCWLQRVCPPLHADWDRNPIVHGFYTLVLCRQLSTNKIVTLSLAGTAVMTFSCSKKNHDVAVELAPRTLQVRHVDPLNGVFAEVMPCLHCMVLFVQLWIVCSLAWL